MQAHSPELKYQILIQASEFLFKQKSACLIGLQSHYSQNKLLLLEDSPFLFTLTGGRLLKLLRQKISEDLQQDSLFLDDDFDNEIYFTNLVSLIAQLIPITSTIEFTVYSDILRLKNNMTNLKLRMPKRFTCFIQEGNTFQLFFDLNKREEYEEYEIIKASFTHPFEKKEKPVVIMIDKDTNQSMLHQSYKSDYNLQLFHRVKKFDRVTQEKLILSNNPELKILSENTQLSSFVEITWSPMDRLFSLKNLTSLHMFQFITVGSSYSFEFRTNPCLEFEMLLGELNSVFLLKCDNYANN
jgi:hypothetical protein